MRSIRLFLVASILAALILFNFVAALQGYQSSMREADTLFDNQMLDLARLVSNLDLSNASTRDLRLGNNLAFQIWSESQLLAASHNAPALPLQNFAPGFEYVNFEGYRWRTFTRYEVPLDRWVIVAERTDLRFVLAENVVLQSILPLLLGIPFVGLLIWIIVSHGLRPLQQLSDALRNKGANDLSPILSANSRIELDQVVESINGFIQRLDRVMEREKRFSADAAHELRTPMSALKIQLHNLSEEMDTKHESFQQLQEGVDRMQHLIEQLLSLYRATPEQFINNCETVDLYAITQDQLASSYPYFEVKEQNVELIGSSIEIEADKFALETLISNLLGNANKYTPRDGSIVVSIDDLGDEVCLKVEDNGPGIPEAEKSRVFDRFYRVAGSDGSSRPPGCGLGLTIVSHVADLHQARVEVKDSSFESGSAFCVYFKKKP
ncbi:MAG: sensor histidine kinase N-terminal domain-containing protein [Gammaproteobacteria bacterium]|nr:sensor histidine kinase N-terminal domain-containing protein [Gammaproteobacteria bacterium]MBL4890362.1 sensor histidine kinase N-terminal domain-containing protein [Rhizobiaceae bacterium]